MLRFMYITGALIAYGIAGAWIYTDWYVPTHTAPIYNPPNALLLILLVLLCLAAAVILTCYACSQNIHRLKAGTVVKRYYRASYQETYTEGGLTAGGVSTGAPIDNGIMHFGGKTYGGIHIAGGEQKTETIPAKYKLKLRDERTGYTGWVIVDGNTYYNHPEGTHFSATAA